MTDPPKKLAKASFTQTQPFVQGTQMMQQREQLLPTPEKYHDMIRRARWYYAYDSIAGTVVDRVADMSMTPIVNTHRAYREEIRNYYDAVARIIRPLLKTLPIPYLVDGMAIPEYRVDKIMGTRISDKLPRTRYYIPKAIWVRDNLNIDIKRGAMGERILLLKIPAADVEMIRSKGKPGREQEYADLVALYPEYVNQVRQGKTSFPLQTAPILRKPAPFNDYPHSYLQRALAPLEYRTSLKKMDYITASRVIEAFRHVKIGSDEYPADDEDIEAAKAVIQSPRTQDTVFNLYTNHTIDVKWVVPPTDTLIDEDKYQEATSDIFMALGFPRQWTVGENQRSNAGDSSTSSVGFIATFESMRDDILVWVRNLYQDLADKNGFLSFPEPSFAPIVNATVQDLLQYATSVYETGAISKHTLAQFYGTTYEREAQHREREHDETSNLPDNTAPQTSPIPNRTRVQREEQPTTEVRDRVTLHEREIE